MESHEEIDQEKGMKELLLNHHPTSLGGVRTLPFILVNEGFERAAFFGLLPNMILYLMGSYGLDMATGSNIIFLWCAATNLAPFLGAFLSDSYVGRFRMIGFGSVFALLGMILLWSTTTIPGVKPSHGKPATPFQLIYLCLSFGLMSIGAGGLRSSGLAFGADQLQNIQDNENPLPGYSRALSSLVNWYSFSMTFAMLVAFTCIVSIQDLMGWEVGFGVPVLLMLVSTISFFAASSFYVKIKPIASVLARPAQVVVASWRNRSSQLGSECVYNAAKGSVFQVPSQKLRFLNKACIVKDQSQDSIKNDENNAPNPWHLCTIDQVEEFKSILKLIPLWSCGIIMNINSTTMSSFLVLQAKSMDRHVSISSFEIPSASFNTFSLIAWMSWLILYDRVIIHLGSKLLGKPVNIDPLTRVGIALIIYTISMVVAGVVESARRGTIMSAFWLVPQVFLIGLADGMVAMAQTEFYLSEFPRSMSSISSNLYGLSYTIANLFASFVLSVVDYVSKQGGKNSWVSSDPNKGHYDYYYWILASFNLLNYMYFLVCRRAFRKDKNVCQDKIDMTN